MKEKERDNALNEVRVLASISHCNIINYREAFFDDTTQSLCIVMELADDGDLQKKINYHIRNHSYFSEN
jgi:NIMA (never in mitosis gene a)-related kinase